MNVSFAFSPCPNDTFAFDALVHGRIAAPFTAVPALHDIEELNALARDGRYELTKLSIGALAGVRDRYTLLRSGGALGPRLRAARGRARAGVAERRGARAHRDPRPGHDRLPAAAAGGAGARRGRRAALRRDPRRRRERAGGRGPDHPREPLHLRGARAGRGRRPGRLVGGRDGHARPAGGHLRATDLDGELRAGAEDALRRSVEHAFAHPPTASSTSAPTRRSCPTRSAGSTSSCTSTSSPATSAMTGWPRSTRCSPAPPARPRDQRALARGRRLCAPAGRAGAAAVRLLRLRAHPGHAAAAVRRARGGGAARRRAAGARRCAAARRRRAHRRSRLGVRRALRRALTAARTPAGRGRRVEADDAIPVHDDGARDDAAHRAARRRARLLRVVRLRAVARSPRLPADGGLRRRAGRRPDRGRRRPAREIYPQADGFAARLARLGRALQPGAAGRDRRGAVHPHHGRAGRRPRRRERARGRGARRAARTCSGAIPDASLPRRLRHDRARARAGRSALGSRRARAAGGASSRSSWPRSGTRRARSCCCSPTMASSRPIPSAACTSTSAARSSCRCCARGATAVRWRPRARRATSSCTCARARSTRRSGCSEQLFGDDAWVVPTAQLAADGVFGPRISERFSARVGDIVVLPRAGIEAWWREPGRFEQKMRGHHGGLEPAEAETWLGALVP